MLHSKSPWLSKVVACLLGGFLAAITLAGEEGGIGASRSARVLQPDVSGLSVQARADLRRLLAVAAAIPRELFRAYQDTRAGEAPPGHALASALQIGFFRQLRALRVDAASGLWRVAPERLRDAARELVGRILEIHATGDVEAGRSLLKRWAEPSPEVAATLDRLGDLELSAPDALRVVPRGL